ncbi:MAG: SF1B family DNA helicase RecD2 [Polyangiales bacterium]
MSSGASSDVIEGTVVRITFQNEESGFRVLKVQPLTAREEPSLFKSRSRALEGELVTVVGVFPAVTPGETIRAVGKLEKDTRHGEQLRAEVVTAVSPTTKAGIERYLSGGAFRGVGKRTAKKIVAHFGVDTIRILDQEPHRLREVPGFGGARAEALAKMWKSQRAVRELMVVLASLEITPALAQRIHKKYGDRALRIVREEPYRLALEVWGVGFKSADAVAQKVGIALDDPHRAEAGVLHTLQALAEEGHTATPRDLLVERAARLLDPVTAADPRNQEAPDAKFAERARTAIDALLKAKLVVAEPEGIAHAHLASEEAGLAKRLHALLSAGAGKPLTGAAKAIDSFQAATQISLAPAQRAAIELVARAPVAVVTGGPGVGKTTVVRAILALFHDAGLKTALAAPTGRAAKRMTEATGNAATTIHRLLEVDPRKGRFSRDEAHPLEIDAVIVDESSMIDVSLAHSLAKAIPDGARVVLVGDVDQLPSVGPGSVLRDAILSSVIPTARLTEVFRQAETSQIVRGAHAILRGEEPEPSESMSRGAHKAGGELFLVERQDPEEAARTIIDIVEGRIPKAFGLDPKRDVQVLVPMVRGSVGTRSLNEGLQARLNPTGVELRRGNTLFRVGDRVMQMRNDYDRDIFNGDVGFVSAIDEDNEMLTVRLEEGRDVTAEGDEIDELSLAYACTVHKSQGSEYPAVVIGLVNQHFVMLARKLLYTAVTRARRLAVIVGSRWALREAVRDARGEERRTTLARRLRS